MRIISNIYVGLCFIMFAYLFVNVKINDLDIININFYILAIIPLYSSIFTAYIKNYNLYTKKTYLFEKYFLYFLYIVILSSVTLIFVNQYLTSSYLVVISIFMILIYIIYSISILYLHNNSFSSIISTIYAILMIIIYITDIKAEFLYQNEFYFVLYNFFLLNLTYDIWSLYSQNKNTKYKNLQLHYLFVLIIVAICMSYITNIIVSNIVNGFSIYQLFNLNINFYISSIIFLLPLILSFDIKSYNRSKLFKIFNIISYLSVLINLLILIMQLNIKQLISDATYMKFYSNLWAISALLVFLIYLYVFFLKLYLSTQNSCLSKRN